MPFRDREAEDAALRRRLSAVLDELMARGVTQTEITAEAQRRSWSTIYRQVKGAARVDPLVVERLERSLSVLNNSRANRASAVRMVPVIGEVGLAGQFFPSAVGEITMPDDALTRGAEYAALRIIDDDDEIGIRAGEVLVYEVGAMPQAGEVAIVDAGGRPRLVRCTSTFTQNGVVAVGTGRQVMTVRRL